MEVFQWKEFLFLEKDILWALLFNNQITRQAPINILFFSLKLLPTNRNKTWTIIKIWLKMGPYNRKCIAASRQPNYYLLRRHAAQRYRLQIVFPGSRDPRGGWRGGSPPCESRQLPRFIFVIFGSRSSYIPTVKNAWGSRDIRRPRSKHNKNNKINCKFFFGLRLSCFPASAKKNEAPPNTRDYTVPLKICFTITCTQVGWLNDKGSVS